MSGFGKRVVTGIAWRAVADVGQEIVQIAFTALLARLMTRADFGLVAMALLFIRFVRSMSQVGFSSAVIQSRDITPGQTSALFLIQGGVNLAISLVAFAAAPLAADFFHQPGLTSVVRVLAWLQFLDSFAFPQVLLQKQMRFARYSLLEIVAVIAGNLVGVVMAYGGYGVWSLVYRLVVQRVVFTVGIWPLAGWLPAKPTFSGIGRLLRFGAHMLWANICNYFSQNLVSIITGRYIGVETLGSFNIAYNLAIVPAQKIQKVLTSVLAPAFADTGDDHASFAGRCHATLFSIGVIFIPMMVGLALVADELVALIYGPKWIEAGGILSVLAFVGLMKGIQHYFNSVIIARGDGAAAISRITTVETMAGLPVFWVGAVWFGMQGLIGAYVLAAALAFVLSARMCDRIAGGSVVVNALSRSMLAAAAMAVAVVICGNLPGGALLVMAVKIVVGAAVYVVVRLVVISETEKSLVRRWPGGGYVVQKG